MAETKQVILIGTAHHYQESGKPSADGLKAFAERLFCKSGIGAIGEEMNREALEERNVSSSVGADLGRALEIPHRYCDPDRNERVRTGIPKKTRSERAYGCRIGAKKNLLRNFGLQNARGNNIGCRNLLIRTGPRYSDAA
jgi:hypothetical protein